MVVNQLGDSGGRHGWPRFLSESLVHQVALVGGRLPRWMGRGPILISTEHPTAAW
jgi:hypothetical protein